MMETKNYEFHTSFYIPAIQKLFFHLPHVAYFLVFQWNSTMSSTTSNDVINVKPNLGCYLLIFIFFIGQED